MSSLPLGESQSEQERKGGLKKRNQKNNKKKNQPQPPVAAISATASEDPQHNYLPHSRSRSDLLRGGSSKEVYFFFPLQRGKLSPASKKPKKETPNLLSESISHGGWGQERC